MVCFKYIILLSALYDYLFVDLLINRTSVNAIQEKNYEILIFYHILIFISTDIKYCIFSDIVETIDMI